jgi:hypothetical protein
MLRLNTMRTASGSEEMARELIRLCDEAKWTMRAELRPQDVKHSNSGITRAGRQSGRAIA